MVGFQISIIEENMLKNWTVTTQAVKGASKGMVIRELYLMSYKHRNHKQTEQIISLIGNKQTSQRIALRGEQFRTIQQMEKRRGRPIESYAVEYCLTLPRGFRPKQKEWFLIVADCCNALAKTLKLDNEEKNEFKNQIRAVLHRQPQTGNRGSGDHVHLIVGKVIKGRVLSYLQKKSATKLIKSAFNTAALNHCHIDHKLYKPKSISTGPRVVDWRYQQQQVEASLESQRALIKLQRQVEKWFEANRANDYRQANRQKNRLNKTLQELSTYRHSRKQKLEIDKLRKSIGISR
ncbi:hypothetical protein AB6E04_17510 [Vibrio amylolyticus]|uniref:hypothetical protein n=1 Tax=Vibrio amylolyticus TaxID=2847292 RepID=UPI003553FDB5